MDHAQPQASQSLLSQRDHLAKAPRSNRSYRRFIALAIILSLLASACSNSSSGESAERDVEEPDAGTETNQTGSDASASITTASGTTVSFSGADTNAPETEVIITLSDADTEGDDGSAPTPATTQQGQALGQAETDQLLARLPQLEELERDRADFARPPQTRPRPRAATTVDSQFPPPDSAAKPEPVTGPLEVLRFQPEGPVDLAPFISVTFNQPMIELGTLSQLEEQTVPIQITPEMPGRWIWLGTRTARFEHEVGAIDRIPAATNFTVEVPAGTTSAAGSELAETVRFDFSTPTVQIVDAWPMTNSMSTTPLVFVRFDQRVDPQAVMATTVLDVDGSPTGIRLATEAEIAQDSAIAARVDGALEGRWLVLTTTSTIANDAPLQLRFGPGLASAEGPETSDDVQSFAGRTHGALRLIEADCGWGDGCFPGSEMRLRFSNPLEPSEFDAATVTIDPPIPGVSIGVQGDVISIRGRSKGQTDYTITVGADLVDTFGQSLGDSVSEQIRVGPAQPALFGFGSDLVTLDPIVDDGVLRITSINNDRLRVKVYQADPVTDWARWLADGWLLAEPSEQASGWSLISEETVDTNAESDEFAEVPIHLADHIGDTGHVVVVVEPTEPGNPDFWQNRPQRVWVQRTYLGVDAVTDNDTALVRVTDLRTGEPVEGAITSFTDGGAGDSTDSDGLAEMALGRQNRGLLAVAGDQRALVGQFWAHGSPRVDQLRWYVVDDRGIYKPGETARLKGWVRQADADTPADLSVVNGSLEWEASDAFGNRIDGGTIELSPAGGFDLAVELPADITLGQGSVMLNVLGNHPHWHELRVQEFRRPDFEVSTEFGSEEQQFVGDTLRVNAAAEYFAGGALTESEIDWSVSANLGTYAPPNWADFNFGIWVPWWQRGGFQQDFFGDEFGGSGFGGFAATEFFSSETDVTGKHRLAVAISTSGKPRPVVVDAQATVVDVNRQAISAGASKLIHPAEHYVGLRGNRAFVAAGENLEVDLIVTDIDGEIVSGSEASVTSTRLEWRFQDGQWQQVPIEDGSCTVTSASGPQTCTFEPSQGGLYRISATVTDQQGRANLTEITRWVTGGKQPANRNVRLENLTLVPDGESWQPGQTAEVLIQSPFTNAHGLAVISRTGIDRTQLIEFDENGSAVLSIPIGEDDIPGVGIQVEVVGTAARIGADGVPDPSLAERPAFAAGSITLAVPPDSRALTIDVTPRDSRLEPGSSTAIDIAVTSPAGDPVAGAELAVIVVDEAVLSLTGYQLNDPLEALYPLPWPETQVWRGRTSLRLSDPLTGQPGEDQRDRQATITADESMEEAEGAVAEFALESAAADVASADADMADGAVARTSAQSIQNQSVEKAQAIDLRTDFDALVVFEPEVTTGPEGRATVELELPDNLTRYRAMVIATAEATDAGIGESNVTARLPVTVRPTPPRFANFGDQFSFPVVVQNATEDSLDIDVALRSTNLELLDGSGTTVNVPANDRVEVRFEVAADQAGVARYQVVAAAGEFGDAAEGSFPVYTPATSESFATYGVIEAGAQVQPMTPPEDVFAQFGGLEISTSSTAVAGLSDAVEYLLEYEYRSSDAFASRILALVALSGAAEAFAPDDGSTRDLGAQISADVDQLVEMQNDDGGFPYWRRGRESVPYNTIQATHALVLADENGTPAPRTTLANALTYLATIENHFDSWYSEATRASLSAYALHVRLLAGDTDTDKAASLYREQGTDRVDVAAWLWPVLAETEFDAEIERMLGNRVTETANAATFATAFGEDAWVVLHSDRRSDAIVLDALLRMRPDSDLVLKTLNGLMSARDRRGHWANIQENSFVLLAAGAYFDRFENADPNFVARTWLGDTYVSEHTYSERGTDINQTLVPMDVLVGDSAVAATAAANPTDIVVERDGEQGRLYYRLGLRYAPVDFELEARDQGFVVDRRYEAVDDPDEVVSNGDGTWTIKSGARVRVRVSMVADSRRTHVALIDPLPAGLEAVNPALATSEVITAPPSDEPPITRFWWSRWFNHQNLRDDRAEAFSTWLSAGSYEYTYVARATTPGTFVVPPARAEQIYEPEVFGRSANTTVTIVD